MHSNFTASARGCSEETLFISFSKGVNGILRDRTCLEKDTNECSCLICDSSCCRTSCVSVQPCTPKVLPNTETFLHSRVFFVTCVVPALCQIMYSLSVCSDGTTSAAPRSFRQNRPPARTLSLTKLSFWPSEVALPFITAPCGEVVRISCLGVRIVELEVNGLRALDSSCDLDDSVVWKSILRSERTLPCWGSLEACQ